MEPSPDQSQKPAAPAENISAAELARRLREPGLEVADEGTHRENRAHASVEIASIFELNSSGPFKWFLREFIDPEYEKAFKALRIPAQREPGETLELVQARYLALRQVKVGMMEREVAHRELLDQNDQEAVRLRQEIDRL